MSELRESLEKREDLAATSDPALQEGADRGEVNLLSYNQLYRLWEKQQWSVYDLDFSQDRIDWHERIPPDERFQRMYGLSAFFCGEQRGAAEPGPLMRAARRGGQRRSSGRSCARCRRRTCGSSCARRSPTRRGTWRSSTASTPRSASWSPR